MAAYGVPTISPTPCVVDPADSSGKRNTERACAAVERIPRAGHPDPRGRVPDPDRDVDGVCNHRQLVAARGTHPWRPGIGSWLLVAVTSTGVLIVVDRITRRLLPLTALLSLSIVFPYRAPARFKVAPRAAGVRNLEARFEEARSSRSIAPGSPTESSPTAAVTCSCGSSRSWAARSVAVGDPSTPHDSPTSPYPPPWHHPRLPQATTSNEVSSSGE